MKHNIRHLFFVAANFTLIASAGVANEKKKIKTAKAYIKAGEFAQAINLANAAADSTAEQT